MDNPRKYKQIDQIIPILKKINAPLGKFCIYGNHDHGGYGSNIYKYIMTKADFTLLQNESTPIEGSDGKRIYLLGIDDTMLGRPDFNLTGQNVPKHTFNIFIKTKIYYRIKDSLDI